MPGTDGRIRPQAEKLSDRRFCGLSPRYRKKNASQGWVAFKISAMARKEGRKSSALANGSSTVVTSIFAGNADLDPSLASLFSSTVRQRYPTLFVKC